MSDEEREKKNATVERWFVLALTVWAIGVFAAGYFDVFW